MVQLSVDAEMQHTVCLPSTGPKISPDSGSPFWPCCTIRPPFLRIAVSLFTACGLSQVRFDQGAFVSGGRKGNPRVLTISGTAAPPRVSGTTPPPSSTWYRMCPQKKSPNRLPSKRCRMRPQKKPRNRFVSKGAGCALKTKPERGSLPKVPDALSKKIPKQVPPEMVSYAISKEDPKYVLFQAASDSP
jgi:hypothetical protein